MSETANEPPQEDADHFNSPINLSREATQINEAFSQQCLRHEPHHLGSKHPFAQPGEEPASVAYRYRKWVLSDTITLVARTELDAELDKDEFITIRAINEWDPKVCLLVIFIVIFIFILFLYFYFSKSQSLNLV